MKYFILLFVISTHLYAQTALTDRLRKIDSYDKAYTRLSETKDDKNFSEFTDKVQKAIEAQKKLEADPNERARLFYEQQVSDKPCAHCPKYLDLVLQVNKIVEKTKDNDVRSSNQKIIELTKLRFLYYSVKSVDEAGDVNCRTFSHMFPGEEEKFKSNKLILAAEEALALPNISDVQLYEGKGKEVHYFYQGEETERNNIIEVVMFPNGNSVIRYYKYDNGFNLPDVGSKLASNKTKVEKEDNYIDINPKIETEKMVIPTDVKFGSIGNKVSLTEDINLKHETQVSFNKQQTNLSLEDQGGKKYLAIQGVNNVDGKKVVDTVVNYDFNLDKDSDLKIGTSVGNTLEAGDKKVGLNNKQTVKLGLTDHDNEYIQVRTFVDENGVATYGVGNKIKAGEGSIGADAQFDRDGKSTYQMNALDQGYVSEARLKYTISPSGEKTYSAVVGANLDTDLKLSSEFSKSKESGTSVAVNFEKKVSETTSMVLSVSQNEKSGTNLLYQFRARF